MEGGVSHHQNHYAATPITPPSPSPSPSPSPKLTAYAFFTCLLAASGGLMYGYDLVVAGGVSIMDDFLQKFYPTVYQDERGIRLHDNYCRYNNLVLQLYTSSLYLSALFTTFFAGNLTRMRGHRVSMVVAGVFFLLGTALGAGAENLEMLILGRVFLGIGIGFSNQAIPLYLSEMAPPRYRGGLHMMFSMNIGFGVVGANLVNYFAQRLHPWGWRLSLAAAGVPGMAVLFAGLFLKDTPRFLISRGEQEKAKEVLIRILGCKDVSREYMELVDARLNDQQQQQLQLVQSNNSSSSSLCLVKTAMGFQKKLWRKKNTPQLVVAIALPFFQQFSGNDAILFYGPFLFKAAGLGAQASLYSTLIIGIVSFVGIMVSILIVDRFGRRKILLTCTSVMLVCMVMIGVVFWLDISTRPTVTVQRLSRMGSVVELGGVCLFVAMFSASWGPLAWLIPSEIFAHDIRSAAQSMTVFTNMLFKFIIAQTFLSMLCAFKFGIFLFFAGWLAVMGLFTLLFLPETKGIPIDHMAHVWRAHWFWGHFVSSNTHASGSA